MGALPAHDLEAAPRASRTGCGTGDRLPKPRPRPAKAESDPPDSVRESQPPVVPCIRFCVESDWLLATLDVWRPKMARSGLEDALRRWGLGLGVGI